MKSIRKFILVLTLGITCVLTLLSIVGAFLGVDGARALFNSTPMVIFWFAITTLFLVGFVYFKKLTKSPGALMIHLGSTLILIGAMYGSARGHAVAARYLGIERVPAGYMRIFEGQATNVITDDAGREVAHLPFEIRLDDFWIEYYGAGSPWRLGVDAPPAVGSKRRRGAEIHWEEGEVAEIPYLDATVKVLRYLPSARPEVDEGGEPTLEIVEADGRISKLAVEVGQHRDLGGGRGRLEIVEVFGHLQIRNGQPVDLEGSTANPAAKITLTTQDGQTSHRYAFGRLEFAGHAQGRDGLELNYRMPEITGAVADSSTELPAMEIEIRGKNGAAEHRWIIARDLRQAAALPIGPALGLTKNGPRGQQQDGDAFLLLLPQDGAVRDYKSRLQVLGVNGVHLAKKVIEVNDPLHFGGYHFYQHSYDTRQGRFTVLGVRSDSGLNVVYVGFALMCFGVAWLFWFRPLWAAIRKEKA